MPLLEIGYVVKPHGLAGDVIVKLITNRVERLDPGTKLFVGSPQPDGPTMLEVQKASPHLGRHIVTFVGVRGIDAAEALRGIVLEAEPIADPDAFFVHELIGAEVVDRDGRSFGTVTAIEANPASDLLVINDTSYVPVRFVVERVPGRLIVEVPDGLLE